MMKALLSTLLLASSLTTGCASTHPGTEGSSLQKNSRIPLKLSAQGIDVDRKDSFQLIEVTFENTSDRWLRLHKASVVVGNSPDTTVSVVVGQDLKDWAQAMDFKLRKEEHNKKLLQSGLLAAGSVAAAAGSSNDDSALRAAGGLAIVGTTAWAVTDTIRQSLRAAQDVDQLP